LAKRAPKFSKPQSNAKALDFRAQREMHIHYANHTVTCVGRSVDRPLGERVFEHTIDRGSRCNRFSWFGLPDVKGDGTLVDVPLKVLTPSLIATLEALLIETRRLNHLRTASCGNDFLVVEYILDVDPELKERELQNTLRSIELKLLGQGG